ncbi:SAM-dependent methyltransferase [Actinomadura sp. HBU206391]|uniref:SAM-dependent methyltransferase n=1 Tax=Actinomadura sp. HBU206391 TaxID=2731692 RepID=UPI00164F1E7D|nr:SAM-dependent methyltransferase [Actinomadura sp. HBU206391]MBC6457867.1 SAM-dependent methyltransferase [Actinomadura sp. HBU206391]
MTDEGRARPKLDTSIAHPARVYDYWLGGKDNYAADREVAERVLAIVPEAPRSVRANRAFLKRAVRLTAEAGVRQFLDIGSGLPTAENSHDIAQQVRPDAHVVYVDNDPIVLVHGNALLAGTGSTTVVQSDARDPEAILGHPEVRRHIDFGQPVAVLLLGVLHFVPDDQDPYGIVARLAKAMVPGSHLILSHLTGDSDPENAKRFLESVNREARAVVRTREEVQRFFDGFELLDPGVVPVDRWRPDGPDAMKRFWLWAGVGRKA